jgi:valyl-tRNA synthetase
MQGDMTDGFRDLKGINIDNLSPDEKWILSILNDKIISIVKSLEEFRFHQAAHDVYEMVWSSFCDWFIEASKVRLSMGGEAKQQALTVLDFVLFKILRLLHPFMPFITEELAHQMGFLKENESIMNEEYPRPLAEKSISVGFEKCADLIKLVEGKFELVRLGRNQRVEYDVPPSKKVAFSIKASNEKAFDFLKAEEDCLKRLLNASEIIFTAQTRIDASIGPADGPTGPADGPTGPTGLTSIGTISLILETHRVDEAEKQKHYRHRDDLQKWIAGSEATLSNEKFLSKAPVNVIEEKKAYQEEKKKELEHVEEVIKGFERVNNL